MHRIWATYKQLIPAAVFLSVGIFGLVGLATGHAARYSVPAEPESGVLKGNLITASDGRASNLLALRFGGSSCSSNPVSTDNAHTAFNFFVSKGFSTIHSAGIIGNFMQESHVDPQVLQYGGGPGRGIAQWTVTDRWATLTKWAGTRNIWALQTQLDFVIYELTTTEKATVPALLGTKNASDAAYQFQLKYERAGTPNNTARSNYANDAFSKYSASAPPVGCAGVMTGL